MSGKAPLREFLRRNPFPNPYTEGFFYREKMRAIHRVAPDVPLGEILEVGGGQSGLTNLLYPEADVVNVDLNPEYASSPPNLGRKIRFVTGDATSLPFGDETFDAVTMFDLLEHVPDDSAAAREALRVLRPGGYVLVSSPNERWRLPYYRALRPVARPEEQLFAEWGHVRRGYSVADLALLFGMPPRATATFINPLTVICHDVSFSRLPGRVRRAVCTALAPVTWLGYALHLPRTPGTETAASWQKPARE